MQNAPLIVIGVAIGVVLVAGARKAVNAWKTWHAGHVSLHDRVAKLEAAFEAKVKGDAEALVAKVTQA